MRTLVYLSCLSFLAAPTFAFAQSPRPSYAPPVPPAKASSPPKSGGFFAPAKPSPVAKAAAPLAAKKCINQGGNPPRIICG
jgi:hypothetical protein